MPCSHDTVAQARAILAGGRFAREVGTVPPRTSVMTSPVAKSMEGADVKRLDTCRSTATCACVTPTTGAIARVLMPCADNRPTTWPPPPYRGRFCRSLRHSDIASVTPAFRDIRRPNSLRIAVCVNRCASGSDAMRGQGVLPRGCLDVGTPRSGPGCGCCGELLGAGKTCAGR